MTETELYDVVIPPGVPRTILREIIEKFPGELVESRQRLKFANMDGDERELLAFRDGPRDRTGGRAVHLRPAEGVHRRGGVTVSAHRTR